MGNWISGKNGIQSSSLLVKFTQCLFQILQLCLIGGSSLQDTVQRILRLVMSNSLALKYNWSGKGMKEGFKNLKLRHTIISKYSTVTGDSYNKLPLLLS